MAIPFIVMFMFSSCKHGDANGMCGNDDDSLVVLFTGDVMLDRGVRNAINVHGFTWLFDSVSPMFKQSDAVVINLECPFADTCFMPILVGQRLCGKAELLMRLWRTIILWIRAFLVFALLSVLFMVQESCLWVVARMKKKCLLRR